MPITSLDFNACYAAVSGRDARFDGQFVLGVRSTGIYCRPSCPARTPKPSNCTFYPTSAAAHLAGYRACKRCLPEAVPGSPAWNVREDVAARAMRLIGEGVVDREGVPGLATRLGYSERQLGRILTDELGAGALALTRAQRAHTARQLLVGTPMLVTDVAFASGFASVRQFNDTISEVFGMAPGMVRAQARAGERGPAGASAGAALSIRLKAREPFGGAAVVEWLGAREIVGLERVESETFTRGIGLARGMALISATPGPDHVAATLRLEHMADLPQLLAKLRRLFDLDADPLAIDAVLARDPRLARSVAAHPGIRLPGTVDPFEMLVRAIVGQQVSVASARTSVQRLVDALGEPLPPNLADADAGVTVTFPAPASVAAHAGDVVRGPVSRTRALVAAAQAVASGELVLDSGQTLAEFTGALEALPGVGPWTSHYVAMRELGSTDIVLTGDSAARAGARALGIPSEPPALASAAAAFSPWRSYLMMHLWRAAAPASVPNERNPHADL